MLYNYNIYKLLLLLFCGGGGGGGRICMSNTLLKEKK